MASCTSACRTFGSVVLGTQLKPRCLPTRQPRRLQAKADADLPDELSRACPVPQNQQPLSEMRELQKDTLFTWAELPAPEFVLRLAAVYLGFFLFLGCPVSAATFDWSREPAQFLASASIGSSFVVTVVLLRLYLGWSHVGNRLLSASVEYEAYDATQSGNKTMMPAAQTGWYDGQLWVKDPAMLMRDRLLSNYTVKPVMARIRTSLLTSSAAAVLSVIVLNAAPRSPEYQSTLQSSQPGITRDRQGMDEGTYWDNVAKWEPDALEGEDPPAGMSVLDHMRAGAQ